MFRADNGKACDRSNRADAELRALDRTVAVQILEAFNRYLISGEGDVKRLHDKESKFRLRLGDYRLCFTPEGEFLRVHWVRHRREAYRD